MFRLQAVTVFLHREFTVKVTAVTQSPNNCAETNNSSAMKL